MRCKIPNFRHPAPPRGAESCKHGTACICRTCISHHGTEGPKYNTGVVPSLTDGTVAQELPQQGEGQRSFVTGELGRRKRKQPAEPNGSKGTCHQGKRLQTARRDSASCQKRSQPAATGQSCDAHAGRERPACGR